GIWHGAGWNFIIWGALHGLAILIHRVWKSNGYKMPALLGWAITMFSVNIFWVFFRAKDLAEASKVLGAMIDYRTLGSFITVNYREIANPYLGNKASLLLLVVSILISLFTKNSFDKSKSMKFNLLNSLELLSFLGIGLLLINRVATFLYFNF
ncbi:MAG: MBOAT family protein, partial [Cetobacterium sp.]